MPVSASPMVDVNIPRFNQALVALLAGSAYLFDLPWLVALTFVVLALSWFGGPAVAPFTRLYVGVVRPRLQPRGPTEFELAAPPRFAQLLGAIFLGVATLALALGWSTLGWVLTLIVTALAALGATARICVGCLIYEKAVKR